MDVNTKNFSMDIQMIKSARVDIKWNQLKGLRQNEMKKIGKHSITCYRCVTHEDKKLLILPHEVSSLIMI